jgi:alkanesulfonate monooxygenase SsuD/methylene tetrahydromethanopterin reductase-like flavin-dependent oxidoreductase (luciferase family)
MQFRSGLFYLFETMGQSTPAEFYAQAADEIRYGEELGFYAACPAEHHFSEHYGIMPRVEHFLSFIAGQTEKMMLWPMVIVVPLSDPVRLAEDCALIDQMSQGRLVFSVGSGYRKYEFDKMGRNIAENAPRVREITDLVVRMFGEDNVEHKGEFYEANGVTLQPKLFKNRTPMVYLTTSREDQIQWAAERGYGIVPAAGFNPGTLKHEYEKHSRYAKAAGQPEMEIKPFFKWIYVDEDHDKAVEEGTRLAMRTLMAFAQGGGKLLSHLIGRSVDTWGELTEKPEWLDQRLDRILASGAGYEEMVQSGWTPFVCGSPDHVAEVLSQSVEAGGNYFIGGFKCGPMPSAQVKNSMRLYQEQVVPQLQAVLDRTSTAPQDRPQESETRL